MAIRLAAPSGLNVTVAFNHNTVDLDGRRLTWCQIITPDNKIVGTGLSRCSTKDKFSRQNGRAYSLANALVRILRFKTLTAREVAELIVTAGDDRLCTLPTSANESRKDRRKSGKKGAPIIESRPAFKALDAIRYGVTAYGETADTMNVINAACDLVQGDIIKRQIGEAEAKEARIRQHKAEGLVKAGK